MQIILASASPRRRELLGMMGVKNFEVLPARGDEISDPALSPCETVKALAAAKAREVCAQVSQSDCVIIAADTVVSKDGRILGKPQSEDEAFEMLSFLSGSSHKVYTGLCVIANGTEICQAEESTVYFRDLSPDEIRRYIATGEPMDKAGSYGIQGKASLFVRRIEGDYYNIVGLPVCRLGQILTKLGVVLT